MTRHRNEVTINRDPTFWQRRTLLEKILIILCILSFIAIVALAVSIYFMTVVNRSYEKETTMYTEALTTFGLATKAPRNDEETVKPVIVHSAQSVPLGGIKTTEKPVEEYCMTSACVQTANRVLNTLDESIDPCDNFYEFACGSYLKNTEIPNDKVNVDSFDIVRDLLEEQLKKIVNEDEQPGEEKPFLLAKRLNKACLNSEIIEERGNKPLADLLESFGGWPVVKGDLWSEESFDWIKMIQKFRMIGLDTSVIFTFTVSTDLKNSTARVTDIDQTSLALSREYLVKGLDDKNVQAYLEFMIDNAVIFGADREKAHDELLKSLEFETRLANISLPREERRNATALYNPFTVKELQEKYPYIQWAEYINALLPNGITVDENEVVINTVPTFFEQLGTVLETTPKRVIANYFMWRVVHETSGTLTKELRDRKLAFFKVLYGLLQQEPRWKECVQFTSSNLPISVGALYIREYFSENSRQAALEMVNNIREEFIKILREISWMDDKNKETAIEKAKLITNHIGYPNELSDVKKVSEFYNDLDIEADNLLLNTLRMKVFHTNYAWGLLRQPVNKTDWITHSRPALVNAFYAPLENSIQFPAGILQDRFFSADRPRYMNYAAIGQFMGHEITHGFDDKGRQFDAEGNLSEWWDKVTQERFLEKAKCIIEQYGNFTDAESKLHLHGINTQGENIADNGGLKEAYLAYQNWVSRNGPEGKLPGLKYTPSQLFWMSAAQIWCAVSRPNYTTNKITTGVHSPNEFRVLGPISNMRDFAFDFNCPEGTRMNPTHKCEVW